MAQHRNDILKTPTIILFNKSENFHCFGYKTEKKYARLAEKAQEEQDSKEDVESDDNDDKKDEEKKYSVAECLYFWRFKMKLYGDYLVGFISC